MNEFAMTLLEIVLLFFKIIIIFFGAIVMIFFDFKRYKEIYGKRTFRQYSLRVARAEMKAEDPPLQHAAKTILVVVWFVVSSIYLFG